jgi:hypothetical protein
LLPGGSPISLVPDFSFESERRSFVLTPAAWVTLATGSRLDLRFLAGAVFERTSFEERTRIAFPLPAGIPPQLLPPIAREQTLNVTTYRVGPLVGAEGWIAFGDHIRVVPGVRLSSAQAGWSLRPSAALAWTF